ncbi:porin [Actinoplanes sp. NPDC049802]|uniref:LppU/SCO3897 family protein n=1 Tax=Actinoplanes sp. NPDC049802 TaxID=3154742 RepID=UPI0034038D3B
MLGKVLGILGAIVVIAVVAVIKVAVVRLAGESTAEAEAGDCVSIGKELDSEVSETTADLVDCSSSEAAYTVVGRVDGTTDVLGSACDQYFKEGDDAVVLAGGDGGDGYLLCVIARP